MTAPRLDPEIQAEMSMQPQAQVVELSDGVLALALPGDDPDEIRALLDS